MHAIPASSTSTKLIIRNFSRQCWTVFLFFLIFFFCYFFLIYFFFCLLPFYKFWLMLKSVPATPILYFAVDPAAQGAWSVSHCFRDCGRAGSIWPGGHNKRSIHIVRLLTQFMLLGVRLFDRLLGLWLFHFCFLLFTFVLCFQILFCFVLFMLAQTSALFVAATACSIHSSTTITSSSSPSWHRPIKGWSAHGRWSQYHTCLQLKLYLQDLLICSILLYKTLYLH